MGPKKDAQVDVMEEKMEMVQADLRREITEVRSEFRQLPRDIDLMKEDVQKIPSMEKKLDLLAGQMSETFQILQSQVRPSMEATAASIDREKQVEEGEFHPKSAQASPSVQSVSRTTPTANPFAPTYGRDY